MFSNSFSFFIFEYNTFIIFFLPLFNMNLMILCPSEGSQQIDLRIDMYFFKKNFRK